MYCGCVQETNLQKFHLTGKIDLVQVFFYFKLFQTGISLAI